MDLTGKLEIVGRTDKGMVRSHNEDSYGSEIGSGITVLADGMGGYKAGEVASALAVNTIIGDIASRLFELDHKTMRENTGFRAESIACRLTVEKANEVIYQTSQNQPQYSGMGTTLVMALFYDNRISIAHVGDSRLYRFRENSLEQITVDHTLLQELVERGFYTPEEAKASLNKNLVTRALGIEPFVKVDLREDIVLPEDIYLLCSDGLNDMLEDSAISLTLQKFSDNLEEVAKQLIDQANANGGKDNVSVILIKSLKTFPAKKRWYQRLFSRSN
ncbi:MAG: Stp1/IreP family PP2C-type Ser/Thr phosphatase [Gammaproteobacteria bacterium]|nr:Stp1/IreP family PP2C-type Ser/Thr phosphatase [Gammaproteobacteria bacterium]